MGAPSFQAMRACFEAKFCELEDKRVPGKSYLERKLDVIEKAEYRAEVLTEVVSTEEDTTDALHTEWTPSGQLRVIRAGAKTSTPT